MKKLTLKTYFLDLQEKGAFKGVEFEKLSNEQNADLLGSYIADLEERVSKSENKEEISSLKESIFESMKSMNDHLLEVSKQQTENLKQRTIEVQAKFDKGGLSQKDLEEFKGVFKAFKANENKIVSLKADLLTTSVANSTVAQKDTQVTRVGNIRLTAYDLFLKRRVLPSEGGTVRYQDYSIASLVRAAQQVAEAGTFPESTLAFEEFQIRLKKTADSLPYSEEFMYDYQYLMAEVSWYLNKNVEIQVNSQIVNGDGTGENYSGMSISFPVYVPVASGIQDPNIADLVMKVKESIESPEGDKYSVDFVMMNSRDIVSNDFMLKKDDNNNYQNLRQMLENMGISVVENNAIPVNEMYVGDRDYADIIEDGLVSMQTGYVGDQLIQGKRTMVISTRKNFRVKNINASGFRKITDIQAALTAIAA